MRRWGNRDWFETEWWEDAKDREQRTILGETFAQQWDISDRLLLSTGIKGHLGFIILLVVHVLIIL